MFTSISDYNFLCPVLEPGIKMYKTITSSVACVHVKLVHFEGVCELFCAEENIWT